MTALSSWRAVDLAAARFFVNVRIAARVMAAAIGIAAGRLSLIEAIALICAFSAYDLVLARRQGLPVAVRAALDCADVSLWCVVTGGPADAPSLLASPLAFETALRGLRRALAVVLVVGTVATATLVWMDVGPAAGPYLWPAAGMVGGFLIRRYADRQTAQRLRLADAEHDAAASRARLAGQSSVAFGPDTVVDTATGLWPLLAGTGPVPKSPLAAWRHRLATSVGDHTEFLGTALFTWQAVHNAASPDLARDVDFHIGGRDSTLLLSRDQVWLLGEVLKTMRPRGRVEVTVRRRALWSQEQRLVVGDQLVRLPADSAPISAPYDAGPIIIALGALGSLGHGLPTFEAIPWPAALALCGTGLLAALWAHRAVLRGGREAHGRVVAIALLFGALDAAVSTLLMSNTATGGLTRTPYLHCLLFLGPLAVVYCPDLTRWARRAAFGTMAVIVVAGLLLMPVPLSPGDLATLVWPVAFFVGTRQIRAVLAQDNAGLAATIAERHRAVVARSHAQGREDVFRLVEQDLAEAARRLRDHGGEIDTAVAAQAAERLADIRRRLDRTTQRDRP